MRRKRRLAIGGIASALALLVAGAAWLGGGRWVSARQGREGVQAVALGAQRQVWIGTGRGLYRIIADGERERASLPEGVRQILVDPGNPAQLYVLSTSGRIWWSQDHGQSWRLTRGHGLPAAGVRTFAYDPSGPLRLMAMVTGHGFFMSDLSGDMWMQLGDRDIAGATAMVINPLDPRTVMVGSPDGLYVSTNQGMRFEEVSPRQSWQLPGAVAQLAVAPDRSKVLAVTDQGLYRSRDGGRSWAQLAPTGLSDVAAAAFAPDRSPLIVAAARSGALAISQNGGETWQPLR